MTWDQDPTGRPEVNGWMEVQGSIKSGRVSWTGQNGPYIQVATGSASQNSIRFIITEEQANARGEGELRLIK